MFADGIAPYGPLVLIGGLVFIPICCELRSILECSVASVCGVGVHFFGVHYLRCSWLRCHFGVLLVSSGWSRAACQDFLGQCWCVLACFSLSGPMGDENGDMFDYSARSTQDVSEDGGDSIVKWDTSGSMVLRQQKLEDALDENFDDFLLLDFSPGRAVVEKDGEKFIAGYRVSEDGSVEFHPQGEWKKLPAESGSDLSDDTPEGGDNVDLSEENAQLKQQLEEANARLAAAAKAERATEAKEYVKSLADEFGLSEAPGFLAAVEKILLADDGDAALMLSDDKGNSVAATATDIVKSLVEALPKKDGKILLSQQAVKVAGDKKPPVDDEQDYSVEGAKERAAEMIKWLGLDDPKMVLS